MANATEDTNQEVKLVKTYCKPADVNVEDLEFIRQQVHLCFIGKRSKGRFQKLLISTGKITKAELKQEMQDQSCSKTLDAIDAVAEQAQADILARDVHFEPVRQFQLRENGKLRDICEESPKQQVFEYIAKGALDPLFRAKLLPSSMAACRARAKSRASGKTNVFCAGHCITKPMLPSVMCERRTPPPRWSAL